MKLFTTEYRKKMILFTTEYRKKMILFTTEYRKKWNSLLRNTVKKWYYLLRNIVKGQVLLLTYCAGREGSRCVDFPSSNICLDRVGVTTPRLGCFIPGKVPRSLLYRRLSPSVSLEGCGESFAPAWFWLPNHSASASRCADWAIPILYAVIQFSLCTRLFMWSSGVFL